MRRGGARRLQRALPALLEGGVAAEGGRARPGGRSARAEAPRPERPGTHGATRGAAEGHARRRTGGCPRSRPTCARPRACSTRPCPCGAPTSPVRRGLDLRQRRPRPDARLASPSSRTRPWSAAATAWAGRCAGCTTPSRGSWAAPLPRPAREDSQGRQDALAQAGPAGRRAGAGPEPARDPGDDGREPAQPRHGIPLGDGAVHGRTFRVARRIEKIVNEKTGKMIHMKNDVVILEDAVCQGVHQQLPPVLPPQRLPLLPRDLAGACRARGASAPFQPVRAGAATARRGVGSAPEHSA